MIKIKQLGNNKKIIDNKELKQIINTSYQKGVVFGCATAAGVVRKHIDKLTPDNLEEVKKELIKFCDGLIAVQVKGGNGNGSNERH